MNILRARVNTPLIIKSVTISNKAILSRLYCLGYKKGAKIKILRELQNKIAVIVQVEEKALIISREVLLDTEVDYA